MRGSVVKRGATSSIVYDEPTAGGRKQRWRGELHHEAKG